MQIVTEIPKSRNEVVRVFIDEFKGRPIFGCRTFYTTDDGDWRPGKNGINLSVDRLPEIIAALTATYDIAIRDGLVEEEARAA